MKEVYIKVKGRVQGVGYRRWAVREANKIGRISGWVRNVSGGDVEILMRGPDEEIETMIAFAHKGPMFARVDKVEYVTEKMSGFLPQIEMGIFREI